MNKNAVYIIRYGGVGVFAFLLIGDSADLLLESSLAESGMIEVR